MIRMFAGFAEDPALEYGELVGANNQRIPGVLGYDLGFLARKMAHQWLRFKIQGISFIDIGRHGLVFVEESIEQAAPILR